MQYNKVEIDVEIIEIEGHNKLTGVFPQLSLYKQYHMRNPL